MQKTFVIGKGIKRKRFTLGSGQKPARQKQASPRAPELKDPKDQPPFFVRGQKAGSKEEYWVSLALEKIEEQTGWGWAYQVPVYGGRRRRGGNVVDFLVYTPGRWTMLQPEGKYWHTGAREDKQEMEDVARKKNWSLIMWYTDETPTEDAVYQRLRQELHL